MTSRRVHGSRGGSARGVPGDLARLRRRPVHGSDLGHADAAPPGTPAGSAADGIPRCGVLLDGPEVGVVDRVDRGRAVVAPAISAVLDSEVDVLAGLEHALGPQRAGRVARGPVGVAAARELLRGETREPEQHVAPTVHGEAGETVEENAGGVFQAPALHGAAVGRELPPLDGAARGRAGRQKDCVHDPDRAVAEDHLDTPAAFDLPRVTLADRLSSPGFDQGFGVATKATGVKTSEPIEPVIVYSRRTPLPSALPFQCCTRYRVETSGSRVTAGTPPKGSPGSPEINVKEPVPPA